MNSIKNNPKIINAWCMYDWANSVYSLVITSTIFPIYFNASTKSAFGGTEIDFLGIRITNSVLYGYAISFSFLIVCLLSPILSGISDNIGNKKSFMKFFAFLGAISCSCLFFFKGNMPEYGLGFAILASIGFAGSLVFYNSYLPEIATPDQYDRVSAKGFMMGYLGSVILQIICLVLVLFPNIFFDVVGKTAEYVSQGQTNNEGLESAKGYFSGVASRISFLMVGIWWAGFSLIPFAILPKSSGVQTVPNKEKKSIDFGAGIRELKKVFHKLKGFPNLKRFLISYFFYNMAVQTVMYLAAAFGSEEMHLPTDILIGAILTIQLVAIGGAYLFAKLSKRKGNVFALSFMIVIWMLICLSAYFINSQTQFLSLAFAVGLVMGGIQSLSRATYSKLLPENEEDTASFFSFYDVMEKLGLIIGPFIFAFTQQMTGTMRNSVWPLLLAFIIGFFLLQKVTVPKNKTDNELNT